MCRQYLPACSVASNKKIMTTCVIVDLAGLSLSNFNTSTQKIMNAYSKIDQVGEMVLHTRWGRWYCV